MKSSRHYGMSGHIDRPSVKSRQCILVNYTMDELEVRFSKIGNLVASLLVCQVSLKHLIGHQLWKFLPNESSCPMRFFVENWHPKRDQGYKKKCPHFIIRGFRSCLQLVIRVR